MFKPSLSLLSRMLKDTKAPIIVTTKSFVRPVKAVKKPTKLLQK
jgi:hypothetical protein